MRSMRDSQLGQASLELITCSNGIRRSKQGMFFNTDIIFASKLLVTKATQILVPAYPRKLIPENC